MVKVIVSGIYLEKLERRFQKNIFDNDYVHNVNKYEKMLLENFKQLRIITCVVSLLKATIIWNGYPSSSIMGEKQG